MEKRFCIFNQLRKRKEKMISFMLMLLMTMSAMALPEKKDWGGDPWNNLSKYASKSVSISSDGVITINSTDDLCTWAYKMRNESNGAEKEKLRKATIKLNSDINLSGYNWQGIGEVGQVFCGTFDGQGHTIYNMNVCKTSNGSYASGFFDRVESNTKIMNVKFESCFSKHVSHCGIVVGYVDGNNVEFSNVTISNCLISCGVHAGAVAGSVNGKSDLVFDGITVKNTVFDEFGTGQVGGIIGTVGWGNCSVTVKNSFISLRPNSGCEFPWATGGIVGLIDHDSTFGVDNCVVDISRKFFSGGNDHGGVVGKFQSTSKPKISHTMIMTTTSYDSSANNSNSTYGLFAGYCTDNVSNIKISDSYVWTGSNSNANQLLSKSIVDKKKYDTPTGMYTYGYITTSASHCKHIVEMNRRGANFTYNMNGQDTDALSNYTIPAIGSLHRLLGFDGSQYIDTITGGIRYANYYDNKVAKMSFLLKDVEQTYDIRHNDSDGNWILADKTTNMSSKQRVDKWSFKGTPTSDEGKFTFDIAERPQIYFCENYPKYNKVNQRVDLKWQVKNGDELDKWENYGGQWYIYNGNDLVAKVPHGQMVWTDTNPKLNEKNVYKVYYVCEKTFYTQADNQVSAISEEISGSYDLDLTCDVPLPVANKVQNTFHLPNAQIMDGSRIRLMKWNSVIAEIYANNPNELIKHLSELTTVYSQTFNYDKSKTSDYIDIVYNQEDLTLDHCNMWSYMWVVDNCQASELQGKIFKTNVVNLAKTENVSFTEMTATKGKYTDRVTLQWKVKNDNNENIQYVITRKEYKSGDNSDPKDWTIIHETSSALKSFSYDDETLPGYVYRYGIRALPYCEGISSDYNVEDKITDIGYAASRGTVMGRITYNNGGNNVEGADVQLIPVSDDLTQASASYAAYFSNTTQRMSLAKNLGSSFWDGNWTLQFLLRNDMKVAETTYLTADSPVGTIGMLNGREAIVVELEVNGEVQKVGVATMNVGALSAEEGAGSTTDADCYGEYFNFDDANDVSKTHLANGWYVPNSEELKALAAKLTWNNTLKGRELKFPEQGTSLFLPAGGWINTSGTKSFTGTRGYVWSSTSSGNKAYRMRIMDSDCVVAADARTDKYNVRPFCKLPASDAINYDIPKKGRLVQLPTGLTLELEEGNIILANGQKIAVNDGAYRDNYIVVTHSSEGYKVGKVVYNEDTEKGTIIMSNAYKEVAVSRPNSIVFGGFTGGIDEVRLWKDVLSDKAICDTYNRYLSGNEKGLKAYYTFDSGVSEYAYDQSHPAGTWNNNHVAMPSNGPEISPVFVPDSKVLGYRGTTDANGEYTVTGIPFTGEGTNYDVYPRLGVHDFQPMSTKRYISTNSLLYSDVNFSDVSSFEMRGTVLYEGTNYPVQGCNVLIDGQAVVDDKSLYETDQYGRFVIQVPIGEHTISIAKDGHTFSTMAPHYFNKILTDVIFFDQTKVTVAGRVAGGVVENNKPLGFGASKANIGQAMITLSAPSGSGYYFTAKRTDDYLSFEASDEVKQFDNATSAVKSQAYTGSAAQGTADKIYIVTDAETGEFAVNLPPIQYVIDEIKGLQTSEYDNKLKELSGFIDARNTTRTYTDSINISEDGGEPIWNKFSYHAYNKFMVTTPSTMRVTQVSPTAENYFGEKGNYIINLQNEKVWVDYVKDGEYKIGVGDQRLPVFYQFDYYRMKVSAFQTYSFMKDGVQQIDEVPLDGIEVGITNQMAAENLVAVDETGKSEILQDVEKAFITLNEKGEGFYEFKAGFPNTAAPYSNTMTLTLGDGSDTMWSLSGIVFGYIPHGNEYLTEGPEKVEMILRDPPGSKSYASWTSGSTVTTAWTSDDVFNFNVQSKFAEKFGVEQGFASGSPGFMVITNAKSLGSSSQEIFNTTVYSTSDGSTTVLTANQTISTSSAKGLDGPDADLFIGNSYNQIIGRAWDVNLYATDANGNYNVGAKYIATNSLRLKTCFAYTQYHIKNIEIPRIRAERRALILTPEDPVPAMDSLYHYRLTAEAWAKVKAANSEAAKDSIYNDSKNVEKISYGNGQYFDKTMLPEGITAPIDYLVQYDTWIENWIMQLYNNEKNKVDANLKTKGDDRKNYSFDGGATINITESNVTTNVVYDNTATSEIGEKVTLGTNVKVNGVGVDIEAYEKFTYTTKSRSYQTEGNSTVFTYVLSDGDANNAITVDILPADDKFSSVFYTRAGQTSGYWQPQYMTEYYEPGMHEIMAPTLKVNKPHLMVINTVDGVENVDVITGVRTGGKAYVKFEIMNQSEAKVGGYYTFGASSSTNEGGLSMKVNGATLNGNKFYLDYLQRDTILVEIQQTDLSVLDHKVKFWLADSEQTSNDYSFSMLNDSKWLTIHFQEMSSEVSLDVDHEVVNKKLLENSGQLVFRLHDYDNKMKALKYIELQKWQDNDWKTVTDGRWTFNPDLAGSAILLSDADVVIMDTIDITNSVLYPDGELKFRARTVSNFGADDAYNYSDVITVIKDVVAPQQMGNTSPANGIYNFDSEVSVTFNEDIQKELIKPNVNVHLKGDLNDGKVTHEVSLLMDGGEGYNTESKVELPNTSMSFNAWIKLIGDEGSILAHGTSNNHMSIGVNQNSQFYIKLGDDTYPSEKSLPKNEWIFLSVICNGEKSVPTVTAECTAEKTGHLMLLNEVPVKAPTSVGATINIGYQLNGYIHDLSMWDYVRPYERALAEKNKAHGKFTPHLIAYWPFNEGHGSVAENKIDGTNLVLGEKNAYNWHIDAENYSVRVPADRQIAINASAASTDDNDDYMLQFWFRADKDIQGTDDLTLLTMGGGSTKITIDSNTGTLSLVGSDNSTDIVTENNIIDDMWHQVSLIVCKNENANAILYLDAKKVAQISASKVANLGELITFGGGGFSGYIDEVRGWHGSYDEDLINKIMYTRFNPDNSQVSLYYPFERKVKGTTNYEYCPTDLGFVYASDSSRPDVMVKDYPLETVTYSSTIAPPLRNSSELQNIKFDLTVSERRITLDITEDPERIEGCVLVASVIGIKDKAGNEMQSSSWSFTVQHDYLQWQSPNMTRSFLTSAFDENNEIVLSATIHNNTGSLREWSIEGTPAWMEASQTSGTLAANESKVITFKVNKSITIGSHVGSIYLVETNGISHKLPFNVTYEAIQPEWSVNANDFEQSMSIIGQVKINGVITENQNSIIAAFNANDECIGLCKPDYLSRFGSYYFILTVFGNKGDDKTVNFRFYNAETGIIHPSVNVDTGKYDVSFAENKVVGSLNEPLFWIPDNKIELNNSLNRGWNWISFNTAGDASVQDVFTQNIYPVGEESAELLQIINGDRLLQNENGVWGGTLDSITTGTMYKVKMSAPAVLKRVGEAVNDLRQPITIKPNWNWLGANVSTRMSLDNALADMNPAEGDVIKNRTEIALFTEGGWIGSLKHIEPGVGYFYNSKANANKIFIYPTSESQIQTRSRSAMLTATRATEVPSEYEAQHLYTGTMTLIAAIEEGDRRLGDCVLEAFDQNGQLRGINVTQDENNRHLVYMVIHGDDPEQITLRVTREQKDSVIEYELPNAISFADNEAIGMISNPYIVNLSATGISNIEYKEEVPMYDLSGRRIDKKTSNGVYIQGRKKMIIK